MDNETPIQPEARVDGHGLMSITEPGSDELLGGKAVVQIDEQEDDEATKQERDEKYFSSFLKNNPNAWETQDE